MSAPTDEEFRNCIEGDNHGHFIIKIDKKHRKYEVATFGPFTTVTDKFCFETEEIRHLCYLTTGGFLGLGGGKPDCKHGARIALAVTSNGRNCPHENGSLQLSILCTGSVDELKAETRTRIKYINEEFYQLDIQDDLHSTYKIMTDPGDLTGTQFRFKDLCKFNGRRKLGETPSDIKVKNCKKSLEVKFELWMRTTERSDFGKIYGPKYGQIEACIHDNECKNAQIPAPTPKTENPSQGNNNVFIQGNLNVGSIGVMGGQNNENQPS